MTRFALIPISLAAGVVLARASVSVAVEPEDADLPKVGGPGSECPSQAASCQQAEAAAKGGAEQPADDGVLAAVASTLGLAEPAPAKDGEPAESLAFAVWSVAVEAVCFFLSLAAVRVASARFGRKAAPKGRFAFWHTAPKPKPKTPVEGKLEVSDTSPEAVIKAWHQSKNKAPASLEVLQATAQALAATSPELLTDELIGHLKKHSLALAFPLTVHMLLDAIGYGGWPALAEALLAPLQHHFSLGQDPRSVEILLGAYASAGDEQKVDDLISRQQQQQDGPAGGKASADGKATARDYSLVIKGFLKCGKTTVAVRYLLEMQQQGHAVPPRAVTEVCKAGIAQGNMPSVAEELLRVVPLPADCVAALLTDCVQREDLQTAQRLESLVKEQDLALTHSSYEALLKIYARVEGPRGTELFEAMQKDGYKASEGLCGSVLAHCAESQNLQLAESVVSHLRARKTMTLSTYKTLMKVYASGGLYDRACDLYKQLLDEGIEPDAVMYGCLVKFSVKCGRTALSKELFEKAGGGYVQNYMWLIRSAGQEGDVQRALELLHKLEATQPGCLDIMVYNCALDACASNGDMASAHQIIEEMKKTCSLNLITYNTVMKGYCNRGNFQKAQEVFAQMEQSGITADSASFNCLISTAVTAGRCNEVWKIIAEMDKRKLPLDQYTISIMMKASRRTQDPVQGERCLAVLDRMGDVKVCEDEVLFNTVLDACIYRRQKGRLSKALEEFSNCKMKPSVRTYGLLIKACSIMKMTSRCWELWSDMVGAHGICPNDITLSCMLDALIEGRQLEEALAIFQEWKNKVPYNTVIYSTLIKGFATSGDGERAMAVYRDMKTEGVQMNLVAYTALIDSQARSGNMEQAVQLLRQMDQDGCQPNTITYSNIVKGYCQTDNLETALKFFQEMLDRGLPADTVIFNTLLDGCVRHSHFELADKLLTDMPMYNVESSNFTLSIIVKMWGKRRDLSKAFEAVRSSISKPGSFRVDPLVGACLVGACLHNHRIDRALEAFEEIKGWKRSDCPDVNTYSSLICGLSRLGHCQRAVELTDEVTVQMAAKGGDSLPKDTLRQLFKALQTHGCAWDLGKPLAERLRQRGIQSDARSRWANPW